MIGIRFDLPFQQQLDFFRSKGFALSPDSWRDVWKDAHARAFTVARVTQVDVLHDVREELDKAMEAGLTPKQFKDNIIPTLERKGWFAPSGEKAMLQLPDGTVRKRLTGWRLDTILDTNVQTAYMVGRYTQQMEVKRYFPFWMYVSILDASTRPTHAAMNGRVWAADHPIWKKWYPPNGFRCRCKVRTLTETQVKRMGLAPEKRGVTEKPDEGWDFNPGEAGLKAWKPDMGKYSGIEQALLRTAIQEGFVAARTVKQAEKWAKDHDLADNVSYKGLDVKTANAWNQSVYEALQDSPKLRQQLEFIGSMQERNRLLKEKIITPRLIREMTAGSLVQSPDILKQARKTAEGVAARMGYNRVSANVYAQASYTPGIKGIAVNVKWGKDAAAFEQAILRDLRTKWHPAGTEGIKSVADHELGHQFDKLLNMSDGNATFKSFYNAEIGKGMDYVVDNLSKYAYRGRIKEFLAEGWCEYVNSPSPRPIAARVGQMIKEAYDAIR